MNTKLFSPLTLPNGSVLPNRVAKAAMEENMAEDGQLPGTGLCELYRHWSAGGSGLLISGNVMVDHRALTGPGAVVLERDTPLAPFKRWAEAGKQNGARFWLQISHPGRQVFANMGGKVWAPSAVPLNMGKHSKLFGQPQEMTEEEIRETIRRFADTAQRAEEAGFDGVEVHAAHGYLLAQFLSPLANHRQDAWGGTLENRARFLLEVVRAIRAVVKPSFALGIKINSADFQRGGFDAADAQQVARWLNELPVDLLEISGGTYESPAMQGQTADHRTLAREAYFLDFARDIAGVAQMPVMTTGGIRRREVAETVLAQGVALAGIATALALVPDLPAQWRAGKSPAAGQRTANWRDKTLTALATMAQVRRQLQRMGRGQSPALDESPLWALLCDRWRLTGLTKRYRRWLHA